MSSRELLFAIPLVVTTIALFWLVPEWPLAHLDDPSHWGVLGYAVTLMMLLELRRRGVRGSRFERNWLLLFLMGMPVVFLANWARFGAEPSWLGVELLGLALYWALALLAVARSPWFLAAGIAAHALWDVWHFGRAAFVPDWYVAGCVIVDLALGLYAAGQVRYWRRQPAESR